MRTLRRRRLEGDFIEVHDDGSWNVNIDKVKAAGPGIVKTLTRDKFGDTTISLADHAEARRFIMEYETTKDANGRATNKGDTRTLMLNLIMGDNATFDQVDAAARAIGTQLRELRESEAKTVVKRVRNVTASAESGQARIPDEVIPPAEAT